MAPASISRRRWLTRGLSALAGTPLAPALARGQTPARQTSAAPRNVVLMVADGMSLGVPTLAEAFSRTVRGSGTAWWALSRRPDVTGGWFDMASLTSLVTDSAAAASSWGSGSRVQNGAINVLPDGTRLEPLGVLARDAGRRLGLVTTTTITHATPAGFAAVSANRNAEEDIATQYLDRVDVLLGGGTRFFDAAHRPDRRDLAAAYQQAGYTVWRTSDELRRGGGGRRVLGLFWPDHLPYSLDRQHDPTMAAQVPTLAEMADAALSRLADSPQGFLLVVEGGRVDHAAHANDAAAILWDQLAFDDAVARVQQFAETRGDTLVVVMSDHGNANPGLNGMGTNYLESSTCFARVARARASGGVVRARLLEVAGTIGQPKVDETRQVVEALMGFAPSVDEATALAASIRRPVATVLNRQLAAFEGVLGQIAANQWGIGWTGTTHTADLTTVLAFGPGRERFHGLHANTDVFGEVLATMGRTYRNPSMTPDAAARMAVVTTGAAEQVPA